MSVSLIIPFMALASGAMPFGKANSLTQALLGFLHILGIRETNRVAAMGIVFLLGVAVANTYLCLYQYYAALTINRQRCNFSLRVLKVLVGHPLDWIEARNSSDLIKVALTDVGFCSSLLNAVTQVLAILLRCLIVYLFFLFTQPRLAVVGLIALSVLYRLVFRVLSDPVKKAGETSQDADQKMFRVANELIGGARVIRATNTEREFFSQYEEAAIRSVSSQVFRVMPSYLTRSGLETATLAVIIGFLISFSVADGSLANGIPILSSYAIAGIRLLPAVQQSLVYAVDIRFFLPSVLALNDLLQDEHLGSGNERGVPLTSTLSFRQTLELEAVSYAYDNGSPVLSDINLRIPYQSRVAFVGETGAGKSTLMDIILTLRTPQKGSLRVDGVELTSDNARSWRSLIGYVPQSIFLLDGTISENVAFGSIIDPQRIALACQKAKLQQFVETLPLGYQTLVGERGVRLSGGQCQRVGIARALYHNPEVIVFDEATSSLDSQTESCVLEALEELKGEKTLLVIAHRLNTVWNFDTIFVIDKGHLVGEGPSSKLLSSCPTFSRLAQHQINLE